MLWKLFLRCFSGPCSLVNLSSAISEHPPGADHWPKPIYPHNLVFLSAYAGPDNLLNTLFSLLGFLCQTAWVITEPTAMPIGMKTGLPAGMYRQRLLSNELPPHLGGCPSSLPRVSGQEAALTRCVFPLNLQNPFSLPWAPSHLFGIT